MRVSYTPVRFSEHEQEVVVPPLRLDLKPFEGQPRKWARTYRLPQLVIKNSRISHAGLGLFLKEAVRAGQPLTLFRRNRISEARAKELKMKVSNLLTLLLTRRRL